MRLPSLTSRRVRLAALALLCAALAPGTWLRTPVGEQMSAAITITPLPVASGAHGGFTAEGLWQLTGSGERFGGYSAMGLLDAGASIRLFSDRGWILTLPRPDLQPDAASRSEMHRLAPTGIPRDDLFDLESAAYDHAARLFWVGYENRHVIYRYGMDGEPRGWLEPDFARRWSANGGIEAMVRLADGRFIALRESAGEGYLFDGDPVDGAEATRFTASYPEDYSPTDMAALPDGRVLVVLRRVVFASPVFEAMIGIADPADISADEPWQVRALVQLEDIVPRENYEAIAVEPADGGAVTVWLASDDNKSLFQRSLLAKLRFDPEDAHEKGRRAEAGAP